MNLNDYIRDIPDFPKEGIIFKDISPLLGNAAALTACIDQLEERLAGMQIDAVAGVEARGFIFGPLLAQRLGVGFVPVRKPGKLPAATVSKSYDLEYGQATIEIHTDAIQPGDRVLVVDDLLATGGTAVAACSLLEEMGGKIVACAFVVELSFLPGRAALGGRDVVSLIQYD
jgi:adenine phosphoribosyltransferase